MFSKTLTKKSTKDYSAQTEQLKQKINDADAVVIGAGAGLSTSAGFTYSGERFTRYFSDFIEKYGFQDMYSGGFYPFDSLEEHWAYWSRYIYINRYMNAPKQVYSNLYDLVKDKDYFVLTTNVDHCFQKAGFDKHRLFYTQGDYGLFQCSTPCHQNTYDNEELVRQMIEAQGFCIVAGKTGEEFEKDIEEDRKEDAQKRGLHLHLGSNELRQSEASLKMKVPSELVPHCPQCGRPMTMNLRADNTFVEDEGWHQAAFRYEDFLRRHKNLNILFLELGVGYNTPGIIKYPFWQMTDKWENVSYACINAGDAAAPEEIKKKSICINGDIGEVILNI